MTATLFTRYYCGVWCDTGMTARASSWLRRRPTPLLQLSCRPSKSRRVLEIISKIVVVVLIIVFILMMVMVVMPLIIITSPGKSPPSPPLNREKQKEKPKRYV